MLNPFKKCGLRLKILVIVKICIIAGFFQVKNSYDLGANALNYTLLFKVYFCGIILARVNFRVSLSLTVSSDYQSHIFG